MNLHLILYLDGLAGAYYNPAKNLSHYVFAELSRHLLSPLQRVSWLEFL
jgi:hypothetical protein